VQSLAPAIDPTVYWALVTPDRGENLQWPW
jgi:hypothetical protein